MSTKLQPNLLLQQQIKGRFLPTSLNNRAEIALTFSAMDQQTQRPVILKYYQNSEHRDIQDAIQRGVMMHAQVRSDYMISLIDFGVHSQYGGVWCVLSREESPNLTRFVKSRGGLGCQETCEILLSLCDALQVLHSDKRIHGNLKPTNVFVKGKTSGPLKVLVSDLLGAGLSRVHKSSSGRITFNDPSFFTYEQASGKPMNAQTDIAAMGLLAYFMLKNSVPFEGRTTDKLLTAVIIGSGRIKIKAEEISGSQKQRELLAKLVNECLSKQSSGRPKDVASLKVALQDILSLGQPSTQSSRSGLEESSTVKPTASLGMPSLTPNHSLMNTLGFGQTLGFDAITDQALRQFQSQHQQSANEYSSSSTRVTGSHKAIITAPPEGFEAEPLDTMPPAEHTLFSGTQSFEDQSNTVMGGLSVEQLHELQSIDLGLASSSPQMTDLGMVGTPAPALTEIGIDFNEDTRPISVSELEQLGIYTAEKPSDVLVQEEWGDLGQWSGFDVDSSPSTLSIDNDIPLEEQTSPNLQQGDFKIDDELKDLGVDEFELDMLLEQAASALVVEEIQPVLTEDLALDNDLHQLDLDQRSTLFNQAIELSDLEPLALNQLEETTLNSLDQDMEDTARIDVSALIAQAGLDHEMNNGESLIERFQASAHTKDTNIANEMESLDDSMGSILGSNSGQVLELFSSPALGIVPERPTLDSDATERLQIPQVLADLEFDDFAVMDPKQSGAFSILDVSSSRDIELSGVKQEIQGIADNKMAHRELDTQLEFQRPEEIFPDVPEWRSLASLKDNPRELSKALLSIPLPLSGQLLPFSQFQLEIEGKEHEEGFFVKGLMSAPHIPVILDPEEEMITNHSSTMWDVVSSEPSQNLAEGLSSIDQPTNSTSGEKLNTRGGNTLLNLSLLVLALILTGLGLMLGSGLELDEIIYLVTGEQETVQSYPSRPILPPPPQTDQRNSVIVAPDIEIEEEIDSKMDEVVEELEIIDIQPKTVNVPSKTSPKMNVRSSDKQNLRKSKQRASKNEGEEPKKSAPSRKRKRRKKTTIIDPFAN